MHEYRELQRRIDDLDQEIEQLKAELAIERHPCPGCLAPPGAVCVAWTRTEGVRAVEVHRQRMELFRMAD